MQPLVELHLIRPDELQLLRPRRSLAFQDAGRDPELVRVALQQRRVSPATRRRPRRDLDLEFRHNTHRFEVELRLRRGLRNLIGFRFHTPRFSEGGSDKYGPTLSNVNNFSSL